MSAACANGARATLAEHDPVPVSTKAGLQPRGRQMLAVTDRCTTETLRYQDLGVSGRPSRWTALTPTPPSLSGKARHPKTARLVTTVLTSTQERTPQQDRATRGMTGCSTPRESKLVVTREIGTGRWVVSISQTQIRD